MRGSFPSAMAVQVWRHDRACVVLQRLFSLAKTATVTLSRSQSRDALQSVTHLCGLDNCRHLGGRRRRLARLLHELGSGIHRSGAKDLTAPRQPFRCPGVTHVSGIWCKPCTKNRPGTDGAPERIRTSDPQIRSLVLYPAELRAPSQGRRTYWGSRAKASAPFGLARESQRGGW